MNFRRSVIIAELWRPEVARPVNVVSNFLRFLEQRSLVVNVLNSVRKHGDTDWRCFFCSNVKFARRDIGESVRYLLNKKFDCLWNCRYCSVRAQNLPGSAINIWLTMFQISSKSVRFRRRYSRTRERRSFEFWPIQYLHDSPRIHSSRIIIVHNIAQFLSTCESHKCC